MYSLPLHISSTHDQHHVIAETGLLIIDTNNNINSVCEGQVWPTAGFAILWEKKEPPKFIISVEIVTEFVGL